MNRLPLPKNLPLLAVCGHSGSGKTTLIEAATRRLRRKGLAVAVVKHDVHGVNVDRRGKDSDRMFRSGADIFLHGPRERLARLHSGGFAELLRRYDLVLVEGWKRAPMPKVWLLGPRESRPPRGVGNILAVLPRGAKRLEAFMAILDDRLAGKRRSANDEC
ncbi:MAG: molybdopterin-guanine dinucleotide biosynthesis protein B [Candidatus Brocadiia bacterium]